MLTNVLLFSESFATAEEEIRSLGGRVAIRLSPELFTAHLPASVVPGTLRSAQPAETTDKAAAGRGETFLRAWTLSRELAGREAVGRGLRWDTPGFEPPKKDDEHLSDEERRRFLSLFRQPAQFSTGTPTSLYLTGTVAVGLVIVSGPSIYGLEFSESQIEKVVAEVLQGLDYLVSANPQAHLRFTLETNVVAVSVAPPDSCPTYESCESVWENPALEQLGYSPGNAGCVEYAEELQGQTGIDWSYVAFFTKYPLKHFAYAGGVRLVMQYSNDGWGPDNINRVFAHETCHIFGAADEYGDCACGGEYGYFDAPNNNCVNCDGQHFTCLMDANELALCTWSRRQIGWNAWSVQTEITDQNGAKASAGPGLAELGGRLWAVYRGESSSTLRACSFDGSLWSEQTEITKQNDAKTSKGPALAQFQGRLWMAYRGESSSDLWACSFDGSSWSQQTKITDQNGAKTSEAPALAVFQDRLWMAYRGESSSDLWACSFDGSSWSAQTKITGQNDATTSKGPALAVFGGLLWMLFRGQGFPDLWACSFDGSHWSPRTKITDQNGAKTPEGPSLAAFDGQLWVAYRGESSNFWSFSFDGSGWLDQTEITKQNDAKLSGTAGLAVFNGALYAVYRGESGNDLWSCSLLPDAPLTAGAAQEKKAA